MLLNIVAVLVAAAHQVAAKGPFLLSLGPSQHVIGNDLWNVTIGSKYGTKLFYKNRDLVGNAVGHYVSYSMSSCRRPLEL
jgi:rhamnogalacturonan endolyase